MLSITVKILMLPLTIIAEKWQSEVNEIKTKLAPKLLEIKQKYRGEELHNKTLALYKIEKISPFYTVKSLAGFFIQIPIFFAAYHMLEEEVLLKGTSFLWIHNLAKPDNFLTLPFSIPYFGNSLNLLPVLMTIATLLSSYIHQDKTLSIQLRKKQKINLYVMATLFFTLFYHFPAGMVLYWSMNNFIALAKSIYSSNKK
jgi:YidC/Oxa1 family membrane protein insertase